MTRMNECFVCGMVLPASDAHFLDVEDPTYKWSRAQCCARCWWDVRRKHGALVERGKVTYAVHVRMDQGDLFEGTFKELLKEGGNHG